MKTINLNKLVGSGKKNNKGYLTINHWIQNHF